MKRSHLILIVLAVFLLKIHAILHCPFDEDELAFVRYTALLISGNLPFVDFIVLATPLFQVLLVPFVLPFRNPETVMFGTKILLLVTWHLGLYFFYRVVQSRFSTQVALWSTALFSLSYVFAMQNLLVRPPSFSMPLFLAFCWYLRTRKKPVHAAVTASAAALLVIVDPRMLPFLALLIAFPAFRGQSTWRLIRFFTGCLVVIAAALLLPFHLNAPEMVLTLVRHVSSKYDQGILYSFRLIAGEWPLLLLSLPGLIELRSEKPRRGIRLGFFFIGIYALIGWGVFSILRPYTFWIYLVPFLSLLSGLGMTRIERRYLRNMTARFRRATLFLMVAVIFLNLGWWTRRGRERVSDLTLERQLAIQKEISVEERRGGSVINLGRYPLNLLSPITFPVLRIEEDITRCTGRMGLGDYFFDELMETLETRKPEIILFSERDHFLRDDLFGYVVKHYRKDGEYLYRIIKEEKQVPGRKRIPWSRANRLLCRDFIRKVVAL